MVYKNFNARNNIIRKNRTYITPVHPNNLKKLTLYTFVTFSNIIVKTIKFFIVLFYGEIS